MNRFSFRRKGSNRKKEEDVMKDFDYSKLSYLRSVYIIISVNNCSFSKGHMSHGGLCYFSH